jgi:hypothetical protein
MDLQAVKRIIDHCNDDGRKLADFDQSALLFTIKQMFNEISKLQSSTGETTDA